MRQKLYSYAKSFSFHSVVAIYFILRPTFADSFLSRQSSRIKTQGSNNRFSSGPATLVTLQGGGEDSLYIGRIRM